MQVLLIILGDVLIGVGCYLVGYVHGSRTYVPFDEKRHMAEIDKKLRYARDGRRKASK